MPLEFSEERWIIEQINNAPDVKYLLIIVKGVTKTISINIDKFEEHFTIAVRASSAVGAIPEPSLLYLSEALACVKEHIKTGNSEQEMMRRYEEVKTLFFKQDEKYSENNEGLLVYDEDKNTASTREEAYRVASNSRMETLKSLMGQINIAIAIRKKMEKFVK